MPRRIRSLMSILRDEVEVFAAENEAHGDERLLPKVVVGLHGRPS